MQEYNPNSRFFWSPNFQYMTIPKLWLNSKSLFVSTSDGTSLPYGSKSSSESTVKKVYGDLDLDSISRFFVVGLLSLFLSWDDVTAIERAGESWGGNAEKYKQIVI